jgi:hypothetical protein
LLDAGADLVFVSLGGTRHEGLVEAGAEEGVAEGVFAAEVE